jgi:hypothetical protein
MKKVILILFFFSLAAISITNVQAQCAVCTKTASQLGAKPARGLNSAIIYLMLTPFLLGGFIGYRWWRSNKAE